MLSCLYRCWLATINLFSPVQSSVLLLVLASRIVLSFQIHRNPWPNLYSSESESSYFTTCGLPSISSSWRQAPWDSRPQIFFLQLNPCGYSSLCNFLSDERMGLSLMNMLGLSSSVGIALIACYWKFFPLHYIQVLGQYRLCKADNVYLTYLML
jgi:hypothetical protein